MNFSKKSVLLSASLAAMIGFGVPACEEKGPAEKTGEALDEAGENIQEAAEETGENLEDAADELKK